MNKILKTIAVVALSLVATAVTAQQGLLVSPAQVAEQTVPPGPTLPNDIANLENWFRADSLITTSGSLVTTWEDIVTGVVLTDHSSLGTNPELNTAGTYDYVDFDGASDVLACGAPNFGACGASLGLNAQSERTTIIRMKLDNIDGNNAVIAGYYETGDGSPSNGDAYAFRDNNSISYNGKATTGGSAISTVPWLTIIIIGEDTDSSGAVDSDEYTWEINGVDQGSYTLDTPPNAGPNSAYDAFTIGDNTSSADFADMQLIEFATWSRVLTTQEISDMETYFDKTP